MYSLAGILISGGKKTISWFQTTILEQLQGNGVFGFLFHYGIYPTFYTKLYEENGKIKVETGVPFGDIFLTLNYEKPEQKNIRALFLIKVDSSF